MKGLRIYAPRPFLIPTVDFVELPNGLTIYYLEGGIKNTIKFEWCFKAGRSTEKVKLVSKICHSLMKEGTDKYTGYEIAEYFDYYGSELNQNAGVDFSSLSFFCLGTYFRPLLDRFIEVILNPLFPEEELLILKQNSISKLHQDLDDAEFVAYRMVTEMIYGADHPYGYNTTEDMIQRINVTDIRRHYQEQYLNTDGFVMVSGDVAPEYRVYIESALGGISLKTRSSLYYPNTETSKVPFYENKTMGKIQCSYKIGNQTIGRNHPDYVPFFIANAIFGGYFNSRLSQVIREKQGLTYDIYSTLDSYYYDGLFYISSEASWQHLSQLRKAIRHQMDLMVDKPVSKAEMERTRAYLMGILIASFDGIFSCADTFRSCLVEGVSFESLQTMIDTVTTITPEEVWKRSRSYFLPESMIEVIIG